MNPSPRQKLSLVLLAKDVLTWPGNKLRVAMKSIAVIETSENLQTGPIVSIETGSVSKGFEVVSVSDCLGHGVRGHEAMPK